jgi:hypothetical protein
MRFVPVSPELHRGKFLRPLPSFAYAAGTPASEVVFSEVSQVAASFPMFFLQFEGINKVLALFGLAQGENLFVDRTGAWTGFYIPAMLRCHPFKLAAGAANGELSILIDEDAGLLSDDEGEPLFGTADGEPNGPVARAIQLLTQLNIDGARTSEMVVQLGQLGLLKATSLNIDRQGVHQPLGGLMAVDEAALGALPEQEFLALRKSGALVLAYAQMFSLAQIARLQVKANLADREMTLS